MQFCFSDQSSANYSAADYLMACKILNGIEHVRAMSAPTIAQPQAGWSEERTFKHAERDERTFDFRASYALLARRDPDILRKLRLYAQTFSGYQLATLRLAEPHVPWVRDKLHDHHDDFLDLLAGGTDRWAERYVELHDGLPPELQFSLPKILGEVGWLHKGKIANHDSHAYLTRIALLHEVKLLEALQLGQPPRILEIGGGFGGLAHMLRQALPHSRYVIVDLPESLAFSAIYLSTIHSGVGSDLITDDVDFEIPYSPGFTFVPSTLFHRMRFPDIDLAVNTLSFAEMSVAQVERYGLFVASNLRAGSGVLFEQNNEYMDGQTEKLFETLSRCFGGVIQFRSELPIRNDYGAARLWTKEPL